MDFGDSLWPMRDALSPDAPTNEITLWSQKWLSGWPGLSHTIIVIPDFSLLRLSGTSMQIEKPVRQIVFVNDGARNNHADTFVRPVNCV